MQPDQELERRVDDSPEFEERVAEVLHQRHRRRWRALTAWILIFSALVIYMYRTSRHLSAENNARIVEIQASRIESCQANYEGMRQVLKPVFPPKYVHTIVEAEQLSLFNETIDNLKKKCVNQTKLK